MAEVIAEVWYWTPGGMSQTPPPGTHHTGYIERSEAERLLREAHAAGFQQAMQGRSRSTAID